MIIASTCRMGFGTFEAKFKPLSLMSTIDRIVVVRKDPGPYIPKLGYKVLPSICKHTIVNAMLTPLILSYVVTQSKADLILAYHYVPHYYFAFIASRLTGKPYILGQTGSDDQILATKPFSGWFLRYVIRHALQLNVPGYSSYNFWKSLGFDKVQILHSTIDTDYFVPSDQQKVYDFIYMGRFESYKGVSKIINSIKAITVKHPELRFAIVGYGSEENKYKAMVNDLQLTGNVSFHGYQSNTREWLQKSRIFVMASESEGLPCALMEAMSCGLVCVTSMVGNIGDILQDGITGYSFDKNDADKLTECLSLAYDLEPELDEMKGKARELIVREHSYQTAIRSWDNVVSKLK